MKTSEFLGRVLPPNGVYFLAEFDGSNSRGHTPFYSPKDLAVAAKAADRDGRDTYFAFASYQTESYRTESGKLRFRTKDNVQACRVQTLDIDVGENKPYGTQQEAAKALNQFCQTAGVSLPSLIVSSGSGLHCYWVLDQSIPRNLWDQLAARFKALTDHLGLKADPAITSDIARILRVPGTHNHKHADPAEVKVLKDNGYEFGVKSWGRHLQSKVEELGVEVKPVGSHEARPKVSSDLAGGLDEYPDSSAHKMAERCQLLRHMRDTKGADQTEPEWYAAIGVLVHTVEAEEVIHDWSSGHVDYDSTATDEKIAQRREAGYGPTTCRSFQDIAGDRCEGCDQKCNSPITLGFLDPEHAGPAEVEVEEEDDEGETTTTTVQLPDFPESVRENFRFASNGRLMARVVKEDEEWWETICNHYVAIDAIFWDEDVEEFGVRLLVKPQKTNRIEEAALPLSVFGRGGSQLMQTLYGKAGLSVIVGKEKQMEVMLKTWIDEVRSTTDLQKVYRHLGWQTDGTYLVGSTLIKEDGSTQQVPLAKSLAVQASPYKPLGSKQRYMEIIDQLYNRTGREAHQFLWLTSFASPILKLAHNNPIGVPVSAWSEKSGAGKTTVCAAGLGVWAEPSSKQLFINAQATTELGLTTTIGQARNMPILLDEATYSWTGEALAKFVYNYSSGQSKQQARADGGLRDNSHLNWCGMMYCTANKSITQEISNAVRNSQPQIARVFELEVPVLDSDDDRIKDDFKAARELLQHYGHLGPEFMQAVVPRQEKLTKALTAEQDWLFKQTQCHVDARYWILTGAAALVAFKLTKALGYHGFDEDRMRRFVVEQIRHMAFLFGESETPTEDVLGELMASLQRGLIVTTTEGGRQERAHFAPGYGPPRSEVTGRAITTTGDLYIPVGTVKAWCTEHDVNYQQFSQNLEEMGVLQNRGVRYYPSKGTQVPSSRTRCWHMRLDNMQSHLTLVDDETSEETSNEQ